MRSYEPRSKVRLLGPLEVVVGCDPLVVDARKALAIEEPGGDPVGGSMSSAHRSPARSHTPTRAGAMDARMVSSRSAVTAARST